MSDAAFEPLEIRVNGEPRRVPGASTLAELLAALGVAERRIAVALNREVVPRSRFASVVLTDGDRVEILQAVGGGA